MADYDSVAEPDEESDLNDAGDRFDLSLQRVRVGELAEVGVEDNETVVTDEGGAVGLFARYDRTAEPGLKAVARRRPAEGNDGHGQGASPQLLNNLGGVDDD